MILLECLNDKPCPESSPTSSHLPKQCMRNIIFKTKVFVFNYEQPSDISSGPTPIIYLVDNPPLYINWADSNDLYFIWTTLRYCNRHTPIIIIISQPSETILSRNNLMHSLLLFWGASVHMECMMSIPIQFIYHAKIYNMIYIYII